MKSRWERLGLRARIALVFAFGGLLLSVTITLVTLTFTRQNLIDERERTALAGFASNAQSVQRQLTDDVGEQGITRILGSLSTSRGELPLLLRGDAPFAESSAQFSDADVPTRLRLVVEAGNAATLRASIKGVPAIVHGIRLPGTGDDVTYDYYEAVLLDDIESTLSSLSLVLAAAGAATTILAAALGSWAAARTLSPLGEVRRAAESLAAGELDTRLEPPADADLASLTASFNGMARSLETRIERDARFASEVSHELRSPLMTLSASVEVLNNNRDTMPERSQTALALLNDDIARFTLLVENLLEISRFDVGTALLQNEPLRVVEFVRQATQHSVRPDASVVASPDVEDLVILADKRRLAQVVANLIENADRYGDGAIDVTISRWNGTVILAVEDHGPGVPESERLVVFDRFSRGSSGGRRGYDTGTGLGLSLVAEHIGLHGGSVWVEDRLDGEPGARFVIALPIGDPEEHIE